MLQISCTVLADSFFKPPIPNACILLQDPPDLILFFGRFHPLFVHLPIGFLFIAVAFEYVSRIQRFKNLGHSTTFVLGLTSISSILAAILGYFLSLEGGYNETTLAWHKWFGIVLAVTTTLAWALKIRVEKSSAALVAKLYTFFMIVSCISLIGAGHNGGSLTHGSDYLTAYAPGPLRSAGAGEAPQLKPLANIQQVVVYTDVVQPVLNLRCTNCHSASKQKGDLRLDGMENILKGGESGEVLIPGKPAKSKLYTYLLLPEGDDKHMPPKGKTQLSKEQIQLIGWWIAGGASADKKVADLKPPDSIQAALKKFGQEEKKAEGIFAKEVDAAAGDKLAAVRAAGMVTAPVAADVNYLQVYLAADQDSFTVKQAQALMPVAKQVAWLNLSGKKIDAEAMASLSKLPNLSRINLANSTLTDAMLQNFPSFNSLEYLNIYGTAVTDEGLKNLIPLKKLRSLYLWQTKTSRQQISMLKKNNPKLVVDTGMLQNMATRQDTLATR